jgi:hypothetical protein
MPSATRTSLHAETQPEDELRTTASAFRRGQGVKRRNGEPHGIRQLLHQRSGVASSRRSEIQDEGRGRLRVYERPQP